MAVIWALLMLVWLGALITGLWWVWPHFESMTLTADLIWALVWLVTGAAAWLLALNLGFQRYWRRR
jgi:hypothetical protein